MIHRILYYLPCWGRTLKHSFICLSAIPINFSMDLSLVSWCNFFSQTLISALCFSAEMGCFDVQRKVWCSSISKRLTDRLQSGQPLHASCKVGFHSSVHDKCKTLKYCVNNIHEIITWFWLAESSAVQMQRSAKKCNTSVKSVIPVRAIPDDDGLKDKRKFYKMMTKLKKKNFAKHLLKVRKNGGIKSKKAYSGTRRYYKGTVKWHKKYQHLHVVNVKCVEDLMWRKEHSIGNQRTQIGWSEQITREILSPSEKEIWSSSTFSKKAFFYHLDH